jgi:hypothetical protein
MNNDRKVFVDIYCKIYTDTFSNKMNYQMATGNEIFEFLMSDAQMCFDDNEQLIPGDCNLWYLGCNEKFGSLRFENKAWRWSFGESSFDRVKEFVTAIYDKGLFTEQQYKVLTNKINEGRLVDNMYDLKDYLICKRDGLSWAKTRRISNFRDEMKQMVADTERVLTGKRYQVYSKERLQ